MTTHRLQSQAKPEPPRMERFDLWAIAVLFICVVSLILGFITISKYGTTPSILIPGMIVGAIAIIKLRK